MASSSVLRDTGETLVRVLARAVAGLVAPDRVLLTNPDGFDEVDWKLSPALTVFLYRLGVSESMRNGPRRVLGGGRTSRPLLPLELFYLITPWAVQAADEHLIAGRVIQALYDRAEIGVSELQGGSWEEGDSVQIMLESLPTEEHYRIWDCAEKPYRLSLAYRVRVVGVEPTETTSAAPVVEAVFGSAPA